MHEEVIRTCLGDAQEIYNEREPRGEYVLVIAGADESADTEKDIHLKMLHVLQRAMRQKA